MEILHISDVEKNHVFADCKAYVLNWKRNQYIIAVPMETELTIIDESSVKAA